MNSTKLAVSLGAVALAVSGLTASAATNVVSDPVGFFKVPINVGNNDVSAPLHRISTFKGLVASATANTVTFQGAPGFGDLAQKDANLAGGVDLRPQYIVVVVNDISNPGAGITGDWWPVLTNTTDTLTVNPGFDNLSAVLQAGDNLEVRKLTSLRDLVGPANDSIMDESTANSDNGTGDSIKTLNGTSFALGIVRNASSQYRVGLANYGDGDLLTFDPNEPVIYTRVAAAGATNLCVLGQVQVTPLTQYFVEGPNAISTTMAANQTLLLSGLASIITAAGAGSSDNSFVIGTEDGIIVLNGTSFGSAIAYNTNSMQWRAGLVNANNTPIEPGAGYVYYVKPGTGGRVWRQIPPYTP